MKYLLLAYSVNVLTCFSCGVILLMNEHPKWGGWVLGVGLFMVVALAFSRFTESPQK